MSAITPHYRSIQQLLTGQSFSIDEYQREYKWEKENIDELLSDLQGRFLNSYGEGDPTSKVSEYKGYFLGSIIVSKRSGKNYLIDGQQRVTSLTLLLIYLYRAAKEQGKGVADTIAPLIFSDSFGVPSFNLDIAERLPVIEALFKGQPFSSDGKDESTGTMYTRYEDIKDSDLVESLGEALPHFLYWLTQRVGLIEIATDNDNDAYAIFETMNDRGKPLSPVDMLKAYLLAPIDDSVLRAEANRVWKQHVLSLILWDGEHEPERDANFFKAWFRAQLAQSIRERRTGSVDKDWELIGSSFHRWVRDQSQRLKIGASAQNRDFINLQFPFFARAYQLILEASRQYTPGLEAVFYNAHNEFTWQNTVLLAPLVVGDDQETVKRKISVTATYLDIWLMRRTVNYIRVGYSTVSYTMFLLCREIRGLSLPELVAKLEQKLKEDDTTFEGSPNKGRYGISSLFINQFSRRYIFHLLARVTAFIEKRSGRPDLFAEYVDRSKSNAFDIEHIVPDNFAEHKTDFDSIGQFYLWRDHVAGLLLLPADVNRSLQDKLFSDKAPHYAKQNLLAASLTESTYQHQPQFKAFRTQHGLPFKPYTTFGEAEQLERRSLLLALTNLVWSPERLQQQLTP